MVLALYDRGRNPLHCRPRTSSQMVAKFRVDQRSVGSWIAVGSHNFEKKPLRLGVSSVMEMTVLARLPSVSYPCKVHSLP